MSTVTTFGWGIVLNVKKQGRLEKVFLENIQKLPPDHFFRKSPWFPDGEYFFLFDALEHFYEGTLNIASGDDKIFITAKSLTLTNYDQNVLTQNRLLTQPTVEESAHIYTIMHQVQYKKEPSWILYTQTY